MLTNSSQSLIVAVERSGGIGKNGKIPWDCPEDLINFRRLTEKGIVVMGSKTFDSLGQPLPNRQNIVLTHRHLEYQRRHSDYSDSELRFVPNISLVEHPFNHGRRIFYIGGTEIFRAALRFVDNIYVSRIETDADCDVFFPLQSDGQLDIPDRFELISALYVDGKTPHIREVYASKSH